MATPQHTLASLSADAQQILLGGASESTKSALMGGLGLSASDSLGVLDMLRRMQTPAAAPAAVAPAPAAPASLAPPAAPAAALAPPAAPPAAARLGDVALATDILRGGGAVREPTEREVADLESAMAALMKAVGGGAKLEAGGTMHGRVMQRVLTGPQFDEWQQTNTIRGADPAQLHMISDLSRGHLLSRVLDTKQMATLAAGGSPALTAQQSFVAGDLAVSRGRPQPLLHLGRAMAYPPMRDVV